MKVPLTERCKGRWMSLLPLLGIERKFLSTKHGPCPFCGGKDRYRFTNRNGSGDWICNQEGSGDGVELVKRFYKLEFKEAALRIEAVLDDARPDYRPAAPFRDAKRDLAAMKALWDRSWAIGPASPAARYLTHARCLPLTSFPANMRFLPDCPYDRDTKHGAILAKVIGPDGVTCNLHRIFITASGQKAKLDPARKLMRGSLPGGAAVRFGHPENVLGVSTGIETSLAARVKFDVPVWATLVDGGLERFVLPEGVNHLMIFGDNDKSYSGQKSAYVLANKAVVQWHITAQVLIPEQAGDDWNDVLIRHSRRAEIAA